MVWLCGIALAPLVAAADARGAEVTLRLRIAWGGGAQRLWQGAVAISDGQFSELAPLGIEADEPGSIWLDQRQIRIHQPSPRAYDGIDVVVTAELDARLTIWLASEQAETAKTVEMALRDLVGQSHNSTLDEVGNRLSVARSPGDRLRVQFDRQHLVFRPGESFAFEVRPYQIETSTARLRLHARIMAHPGGQRVWSQDYTTGDEGTSTSITLRVPESEGVYDLWLGVQPSRLKIGPQKPLAERKIQFVVLDPRASPAAGEAPTAPVVEINPANSRWWERFANLPQIQIPGLSKGPLGTGDAAPWEHPALGPMTQLGPGPGASEISWEAYPLPIDHPGQVHVLEIEYPSDVPQAMGISLVEPNAAGAVMPIGLDSGVYVSSDDANNPPTMARHRVVFWPKTKTPLVLITNRRPGARAVYGKISVLSAPKSQLSMLTLSRNGGTSALSPAFPLDRRPERLWAAYLARPLVAENFGAPEALDGHSSLDDWNTFYQGGTRLVNYLEHVGFGGLMLSVLADGSTIYPSHVVQPTPRYDTGAFFSSGQDPVRKDVLELLFRLFDRESLVLIPALQLAAPLVELETIKRAGGAEAAGIEWIGDDGQPLRPAADAQGGTAPYYNLLDPRVQQAILNVAEEVVARYAAHESFGGLALTLSPDGYTQLPGDAWGFDDRTIERFERETQTQVPGAGPQRFAQRAGFLLGPGREAWLDWRAGVVADFHHRISDMINQRRAGANLYLAGGNMLEDRQMQQRLRPALTRRARLDDALKELGIHMPAYQAAPGIVMLRPQLVRPVEGRLPLVAMESEIYLSGEMDRLFSTGARGTLFYHEPQKARLASFDLASPFGAANTYTWLVSQMSPSGGRNRRRFVHSLATSDAAEMFDGGWMLAMGQEASLKDVLSVYRQLPAKPFETASGEFQPLTIRTLTHQGQTWVYLVNDSPWPVGVTMQVEAQPDCVVEKIGDSAGVGRLARSATATTWNVQLRPYDLVGARLSSPQARLRNPVVTVPPHVRHSLERRIGDLVARVRTLGNPQPLGALANPGFELPPEGQSISGWTAAAPMGGRVALDGGWKHGGMSSALLAGTGQAVSIASAPFAPPTTGRLAVEAYVRATGAAQPPSLRIAVEGRGPGGAFDERGVIERIDTSAAPGGWELYHFPIDTLPTEGLSELRVRFDLLGAGEIRIDDVRVFDLRFDPQELLELGKLVSLASVHLDKGQFADCARLLDGYWPQFLVANVPLDTANPPLATRPQTAPPQEPPPKEAKKPSLLESLRSYVPRFR